MSEIPPIHAGLAPFDNVLIGYAFDLGQKIKVEKRIVNSFPQLFGDLGGLYEFVATIIVFLIGRYKSGVYNLHQVTSQFRLPASSKTFQEIINSNGG